MFLAGDQTIQHKALAQAADLAGGGIAQVDGAEGHIASGVAEIIQTQVMDTRLRIPEYQVSTE